MSPFVRPLRWYYRTVRLPASVHHGRVRVVHHAGLAAMGKARRRASRVPHTMFPRMPGVFDPARCGYALPERRARCCLPRVRSASAPRTRPISGLYTLPAHSPVNASQSSLPRLAHDSGPAWLAKSSLSETCISSHCAGLSRHTRDIMPSNGGRLPPAVTRVSFPRPGPHEAATSSPTSEVPHGAVSPPLPGQGGAHSDAGRGGGRPRP